ncbi:MAG TPA: hypothetical protein VJ437_13690 [Acidiferrobacterales bacterium]|nr:hypothetical protein [Acidiferrobacterales bacterium]
MDRWTRPRLLSPRDNWLHVLLVIAISLLVMFFQYMAIFGGFYPAEQFQLFSAPISIVFGLWLIAWLYVRLHRLNRLYALGGIIRKILLYPVFSAISAFLSYLVFSVGLPASINLAIGKETQMTVTVASKKDGRTKSGCYYALYLDEPGFTVFPLCVDEQTYYSTNINTEYRVRVLKSWLGVTIGKTSLTLPSSGPATPAAEGQRWTMRKTADQSNLRGR